MTPFAYVKWGSIAAAILVIAVGAYHAGGMASTARYQSLQAAQSQLTAKAVLAERASAQVESDRLHKVLSDYESTPIDPVVPGIAGRLYKYALASNPVPCAGPNPSGTVTASAVPRGDPELERLSQAAFDAAGHDAKELTALQQAWPR